MSGEADSTPGIIAPGPELRAKIERSAASLAKRDKRKADEMMAKVLASQRREEFLYFEMTHVFYPFFLQKLNEYRAHPELIPTDKDGAAKGTGAPGTEGAVTSTTTVKAGGIVRREGGTRRSEVLQQAEVEAQRYLEDPFPSKYSLDLLHGTVDIPTTTFNYMTCTAQYVAKYGDRFLQDLTARHRNNAAFRFLNSEDVRHEVLLKLIESYRRILHFDSDEVEDRLERYHSVRYIIDTVCKEKVKYARAAIARQKAALLTDEELREKLEWNVFTVVQNFSASDLGLDAPMPEAVAARRRARFEAPNNVADLPVSGGGDSTKDEHFGAPANGTFVGEQDASREPKPPEGMMAPPTFSPTFISSSLIQPADQPVATSNCRKRTHDDVDGNNSA